MAMMRARWLLVLVPVLIAIRAVAQTPSSEAGAPSASAMPPITSMALAAPNYNWQTLATEHADIYFPSGSYTPVSIRRHARAAERAIAANLKWLGAKRADARVHIFFVSSRADMRQFVGGTPGGSAIEMEGTAFLVANDSVRPALRHETMHLLAWREWGPPAASWLSEGMATASVPSCRGFSTEQIAAVLDRAGLLVPLDTLRQNFNIAGEQGVVHYYQSASLVRYIDRVYGRQRLRALWTAGGLISVAQILGVDAATLERNWRASIAREKAPTTWPALWSEIRAFGCE